MKVGRVEGPGRGTHTDLKDPRPDLEFGRVRDGRPTRFLAGRSVAILEWGPHVLLFQKVFEAN